MLSHRGKNRLILAFAAATLVASLSAGAVAAGEITGNGKLKDVNGRSACAFSGQEDLQWYLDDGQHDAEAPGNDRQGIPEPRAVVGTDPEGGPSVPDVNRSQPWHCL